MVILATGCTGISIFDKKDYSLPVVSITSIIQDGDTTRVAVEVTPGLQPLDFLGIAFSQEADFAIEDNQQLYPLTKAGSLEIALAGLESEKTYYFRVFMGDAQYLAESGVVSFFIPRPDAPVIPCQVTLNTISHPTAAFDVYYVREVNPNGSYTNYGLGLEAGQVTMTFSFVSVPTSGTYTTVSNSDRAIAARDVHGAISLNGFQFGSFTEGQSIYVEKLGDKHFIVSFCDLAHSLNSVLYSGQVEID